MKSLDNTMYLKDRKSFFSKTKKEESFLLSKCNLLRSLKRERI